jgi:hypothetical protein
MAGRSSLSRPTPARAVLAAALLVSASVLMVACTIKSPGTTSPQNPGPTQGPFASVGTETVPAVP